MSRLLVKSCVLSMAIIVVSGIASAADLLDQVRARGTLAVGTEMQFAPYDFKINNEHTGYNKDLYEQIAKELGVKVTFADLPWPSVLPGLSAGKFDMVGGPVTYTAERAKSYAFTSPIDLVATTLLRRADDKEMTQISDIKGKVVGGMRGDRTLGELKVIAKQYGAEEVREYISSSQAYADLAAGRISAVSNQNSNNGYTAAQRPEVFAVVPGSFGEAGYVAFVARVDEDSKPLVAAVDDALAKMKRDGRLAALQKKWLGAAVDLPATVDPVDQ